MSSVRKIVPLSEFKKRTAEYLRDLESSSEPLVVTLHGRGLFVVQRPELYSEMEELARQAHQQIMFEELLEKSKAEMP